MSHQFDNHDPGGNHPNYSICNSKGYELLQRGQCLFFVHHECSSMNFIPRTDTEGESENLDREYKITDS